MGEQGRQEEELRQDLLVGRFLTGQEPVMVCGPGVGDPDLYNETVCET